jgi:hypothetical protein
MIPTFIETRLGKGHLSVWRDYYSLVEKRISNLLLALGCQQRTGETKGNRQ